MNDNMYLKLNCYHNIIPNGQINFYVMTDKFVMIQFEIFSLEFPKKTPLEAVQECPRRKRDSSSVLK